jgi:hypothetical protein
MRSDVSIDGSRVSIEIPAMGIQGAHKLILGGLFAFLLFEALFLLPIRTRGDSFSGADLPLFFLFATMMFVVPVIACGRLILSSARKRVSVEASPAGLRVEERAPLHSKVTEISGHELEEFGYADVEAELSRMRGAQATEGIQISGGGAKQVAIPPVMRSLLRSLGRGGKITARSDRDSVSFGNELSNAEAEYLVAVIKKALVG